MTAPETPDPGRVWQKADVLLADRLEREGRTWMQIWREISNGRGSNNSLRQAVVAYRENGWPSRRRKPRYVQGRVEKDMPPGTAAAILSRPTARQAALLACEPQDALARLSAW